MQNKIFHSWHQGLSDNTHFQEYAESLYQEHKLSNKPGYNYIDNLSSLNLDLAALEFNENRSFFDRSAFGAESSSILSISTLPATFNNNVYDTVTLDDSHSLKKHLKDFFDLKTIIINVHRQRPNNLIGLHKDTNRTLVNVHKEDFAISKIRKYIVFVSPWSEGQVFMLGTSAYTNWNVGDIINFEWYMPHATANAGIHDRYILFIAGVAN
jgi:hypothetical protein